MGDSTASGRRGGLAGLFVPGYGEGLPSELWLLFLARIVNALAFTSAFPFLAAYLREERGVAGLLVGALYTAQGVVGALFQGAGGLLAERVGQRAVLVWSLVARAGLTALMGLSLEARQPVLVVAVLVVANAVLAGLFQPSADSLVAELAPPDKRVTAFAHQRVAINVGWAIAPALGGFLSERFSLAHTFLAAGPLVLGGALVLSRLPARVRAAVPSRSLGAQLRETLEARALRWHLLGALLTFTLAGQMVVTLSLDATGRMHLDKREVGLVWALNGALVVFAQMPAARLVARFGLRRALVASSVLYGLAYAAVGLVSTFAGLAACMVFVTLGELLNTPAQQSAVASRAAPEALGRTMGVLGLVTMLGRSLGPLAGGAAHDAWGDRPLLMWSAIGALGWVAALVYTHPSLRDERDARPAPTRS